MIQIMKILLIDTSEEVNNSKYIYHFNSLFLISFEFNSSLVFLFMQRNMHFIYDKFTEKINNYTL